MSGSTNQAEKIRDAISKITGAKFELREVGNLPAHFEHSVWFMRCREITQASKIPYVNCLWKENGDILMESMMLGNTSQWILEAYGEETARASLDINYSDFSSELQVEFESKYPQVYRRIKEYEDIAARVSQERDVHVELRKRGSKGIAVFTFATKIKEVDIEPLEKKLQTNIEAMKEAYQQTTKE